MAKRCVRQTKVNLVDRFRELKQRGKRSIQDRQARITLGPSIMRVFKEGTGDVVRPLLERVRLDGLPRCRSQKRYRRWFEKQLEQITHGILSRNGENKRIHPGCQWGHAAKILNAFMQGMVRQSHYFSDSDARRIESWLYVPLDSYVMRELRACGVGTPAKINEIDENTFYRLQDAMGTEAAKAGVSRILFDDVWAGNRA